MKHLIAGYGGEIIDRRMAVNMRWIQSVAFSMIGAKLLDQIDR